MTKTKSPTRPARGSSQRRPSPRRSRKRPTLARRIGQGLERQSQDITGIMLLLVAALSALGLYADGGPVGRALEWLFRVAIGSIAVVVPPVLGWVGVLSLRRREADEPGRVAIGTFVSVLGLCGLFHLVGADDLQVIRLDRLPSVGGVFGAALAWPLERLLSAWGAGFFLSREGRTAGP